MAILPIVEVPDPRLRQISSPVEKVDSEVRALVADMFETMYAAPGIDRKSTRLNSSHSQISYAVFCLKKKQMLLHFTTHGQVRQAFPADMYDAPIHVDSQTNSYDGSRCTR